MQTSASFLRMRRPQARDKWPRERRSDFGSRAAVWTATLAPYPYRILGSMRA